MTQTIEIPRRKAPPEPTERLWTREEYYRLAEQGYFDGQRVELIEGRIVEMPPQGLPHTKAVELVDRYVRIAFREGFRHRVQMPFRAADGSDPEPDVLVLPGDPRDPADGHPTSGALLVEVSDSSLRHDRRKARLYAVSGIRDFWIVNLLDGTLEVYRDPVESPSATIPPYVTVRVLKREETLAPLGAPNAIVRVAELLP